MDNEKIIEFMTKMYAELKGDQEKMYADLKDDQKKMYADLKSDQEKMYAEMQEGFKSVNERLSFLEKTVSRIEIDHGQKLSALFDGYVQNSEKLDRIETEVAKHEEFIIKRIK